MKKLVVGWREFIRLPDLFDGRIKCKVDTGATSSSLHAQVIEIFEKPTTDETHQTMVRFVFYPDAGIGNVERGIEQVAPLLEFRSVRSSNGQLSRRPVIITNAMLHKVMWPIEITLADRRRMGFSMLLGREAMRGRFLVDPQRSFWIRKQKPHPPT